MSGWTIKCNIYKKEKIYIFDCIVLRKMQTSKVSKANPGTGGDYLGKWMG